MGKLLGRSLELPNAFFPPSFERYSERQSIYYAVLILSESTKRLKFYLIYLVGHGHQIDSINSLNCVNSLSNFHVSHQQKSFRK